MLQNSFVIAKFFTESAYIYDSVNEERFHDAPPPKVAPSSAKVLLSDSCVLLVCVCFMAVFSCVFFVS